MCNQTRHTSGHMGSKHERGLEVDIKSISLVIVGSGYCLIKKLKGSISIAYVRVIYTQTLAIIYSFNLLHA